MSVRHKLAIALILIGALLAMPAVHGVRNLSELQDIALELRGPQAAAAIAVQELQIALGELDRYQRSYLVSPDPEPRRAMWQALATATGSLSELDRAGYGDESAISRAFVGQLIAATAEVERLVEAGEPMAATDYFEETKQTIDLAEQSLTPIATAVDRASADAVARAGQISASAQRSIRIVAMISIVFAVFLGWSIARALTRPLDRLRDAMARVATGDFDTPTDLPYKSPDELGDLSRSFRSMATELAELQRLRAEFVGVASHELKNPLSVIGGYAELLEEGQCGELTDEQRQPVHVIAEQVETLSTLVNQLVNLSRCEAGGLDLQRAPLRVDDLLNGVSMTFRALSQQQEIDLKIVFDTSCPEEVWGDHDRLRNEVLGNLMSNAFKFTRRGGRITVRALGEDGHCRIEIADTGEGIPADDLPHVFERFYQHDSEARHLGSGLGLAIAREMIRAHGGTIGVESAVGEGTTFYFVIPTRQEDVITGYDSSEEMGEIRAS